jgi:hypothetical protein
MTAPGALRVALALAALLAAAALLLPESLRPLLIPLAFLAGAALERYRHGLPRRPPSLRATPAAWRASVGRSVGWPAALVAVGAVAVAGALLLGERDPPRSSGGGRVRTSARTPATPALAFRRERLGRRFGNAGAQFRVFLASARWARTIHRRPPGRGRRWVTIGVHARNLRRAQFDPTRLAFRLRDESGAAYIGDFRGGTGPRSLARRGSLAPGESALVQLGFRVPVRAHRLTLVFEDRLVDGEQIRVRLPAR